MFVFIVPGMVSNLTAKVNLTSVVLSWSPPEKANGVIITYEVTYRVNYSNNFTVNLSAASTMLTIQLTPNTNISDISVRAYTSIGPGNSTVHQDISTKSYQQNNIPGIGDIIFVSNNMYVARTH